MSAEDDAITQLRAQKSEAEAQQEQQAWASEQARSLIMRYIRSLKQAGRSPAELQQPIYTRTDSEIVSGTRRNRVVTHEHRWECDYQPAGTGWPVLWAYGFATINRRVEDSYGDTIHPGYEAPVSLVYNESTGRIITGVPADAPLRTYNPTGYGAPEVVVASQRLLTSPVMSGASCPSRKDQCDGRCGLPLWVKSYETSSELELLSKLLRRTTDTVLTDVPYIGSTIKVTAPPGRDGKAWNWYLEGLLNRLDRNLAIQGVDWSD